jgi:hypothetical protein
VLEKAPDGNKDEAEKFSKQGDEERRHGIFWKLENKHVWCPQWNDSHLSRGLSTRQFLAVHMNFVCLVPYRYLHLRKLRASDWLMTRSSGCRTERESGGVNEVWIIGITIYIRTMPNDSDLLRAGRPMYCSSSPSTVKNFHFSILSRPALGHNLLAHG